MTGEPGPQGRIVPFAIWVAIVAGTVAAFWSLFSFDPREGVVRATTGVEGALFDPSGEDPRLIGVLAFWMLLTRRGRIAAAWARGAGSPALAGALFAAAFATMAWAAHVGAPDLQIHALQLFVLGSAALLAGRDGLRAVRLPVLFLFLAVPIPAALLNALLLPLQLATVQICTSVLNAVGIEAWGIGDQIFTHRGIFHVIETCSGVRLVQTLVMASVVYAELFGRRTQRTLLLLALSPVVGIVVNLARILSIIFNPYASISSVHTTQGVAMVVVGVLVLAGIDRVLDRVLPESPRQAGARTPLLRLGVSGRQAAIGAVVVGLLLVGTWVPRWSSDEDRPPLRRLPKRIDDRRAGGKSADLVFLGSVHFSERLYREYTPPEGAGVGHPAGILLFLGVDDHQNRRGSMLSGKTAYPGRAWQRLAVERDALEDGTEVEVGLFESPESRQLTVHWREGFGGPVAEAVRAWTGLDRSRFRRPGRAVVWRISAEVAAAEEIEATRVELLRFAQSAKRAWAEAEANVRPPK